jgi:hypothetical protein
MQTQSALIQSLLVFMVLVSAACAQQVGTTSASASASESRTPDLGVIIQKLQEAQEANRPQLPYEAVRDYRFFEADPARTSAEVVARITFVPPNVKKYTIQNHTGSSRGEDIVRHILDKESSMTAQDPDASLRAVSAQNYEFAYLGDDDLNGTSCYKLKISPKHKDISMVEGQVWVDQNPFLIRRIDGEMSKSPSWWLKRVHLVMDFGSLAGTWQQTGTQATADVRMVGKRTLVSKVVDYRAGEIVALQRPTVLRTFQAKHLAVAVRR